MTESNGLICAFILDGTGGGRQVDWQEIRAWTAEQGVLWLHLDRTGKDARRWLRKESGIDPVVCHTLLQKEVRPRVLALDDALLVVLRGVNLNPGADPEDMVDVRAWLESNRIVTLRKRRLMAVKDLQEALGAGTGPKGPGEFLQQLNEKLLDRIGPVIDDLDDQVDQKGGRGAHGAERGFAHEAWCHPPRGDFLAPLLVATA